MIIKYKINIIYVLFLKKNIIKNIGFTIFSRSMMSAACGSTSRTAYHLLKMLTSSSILDMQQNNNTPLVQGLVHYGLDNKQGIMPHKSKLLMHTLSGNNLNLEMIYDQYKKITGYENVTTGPILTDSRVIAELPTLYQYQQTFGSDIIKINANGDKETALVLAGSKQPHPDFTTVLKLIWKGMSFNNNPTKVIINDQKSGTGMLAHSTSGSLGCIYFDPKGNPIKFMTYPYTYEQLLLHDNSNLNAILNALKQDNLRDDFIHLKRDASSILNNNALTLEERHNQYQMFMWKNVQLNPKYNRALSLIFCETVDFSQKDNPLNAFQYEFITLCEKRNKTFFDLNKRGDCAMFTNIMLNAYKKTVDPLIMEKLQYLNKEGLITFNKKFFDDFASILKKNAIFT